MIPGDDAARSGGTSKARPGGEQISPKAGRHGRSRPTPASLLRRKSRTLFHNLTFALTGETEAIHQVRVSGRRLRVALLLLSAKPDGRRAQRVQRSLRDLARIAGKARDLDVLVETYTARLKALPGRTDEQRRFMHRLRDARRRGRARMIDELLDADVKLLLQDLAQLIARARADPPTLARRVHDLATREGSALTEGFVRVGALLDPSELHALRRKARRLRYAVEVFDESLQVSSGGTKPWKALQESIGAIHDYDMLAGWFDRQGASDESRGQRATAAAARSEAGWARATMAKLHDVFLTSPPAALVRQGLTAMGTSSPGPAGA